MTLNTTVVQQGSDRSSVRSTATPIVLLHGFTQNTECWGGFDRALAQRFPDRQVVAVDAPGHGSSEHDSVDLVATADLVVDSVEQIGIRSAVYVGYSMGGRTGLHVAVYRPNRVAGLVLIGASPGLADAGERRIRRMADERLAEQLLADGLEVFLDRWLAKPLFAGLPQEAMAKQARMANRPAGLAASLRHCGTGAQQNLWPRLLQVRCPVLLAHGSQDAKFARIAERMAAELARRVSYPAEGGQTAGAQSSGVEVVAVAGTHAVHLEQPSTVASTVAEFASGHQL